MVIVEADSGMMPSEVEEERKLILEDFFLKQIIMKITKYGLKIMSEADYLEFKSTTKTTYSLLFIFINLLDRNCKLKTCEIN